MSNLDNESPWRHIAFAFLPVPVWAGLLSVLANADPAGAAGIAVLTTVAFIAGLLLLKPLVFAFAALVLGRSLWAWYRGRKLESRRLESGAMRVVGLIYAPIFGAIAAVIGVADAWTPGGWSPLFAGLVYGAVGFAYTLAVHRSILIGAVGVMAITQEGESGGDYSGPRTAPPSPPASGAGLRPAAPPTANGQASQAAEADRDR